MPRLRKIIDLSTSKDSPGWIVLKSSMRNGGRSCASETVSGSTVFPDASRTCNIKLAETPQYIFLYIEIGDLPTFVNVIFNLGSSFNLQASRSSFVERLSPFFVSGISGV